jgi:uncharacterized membrane protein
LEKWGRFQTLNPSKKALGFGLAPAMVAIVLAIHGNVFLRKRWKKRLCNSPMIDPMNVLIIFRVIIDLFVHMDKISASSWKSWGSGRLKRTMDIPVMPLSVLVVLALAMVIPVLGGNTVTVSGEVVASPGPHAGFSASPLMGRSPLFVKFSDRSTGAISRWAWDFQNDGIVDSRVRNPVYIYKKEGTYTVKLMVSGSSGTDTEVKTGYITVTAPSRRPFARFTQDRYFGPEPLTVKFTDRSLYNPTSYLWRFGDGNTSTLKDPVHTYTRSGIYYVELQVSNDAGSSRAWGIAIALRSRGL